MTWRGASGRGFICRTRGATVTSVSRAASGLRWIDGMPRRDFARVTSGPRVMTTGSYCAARTTISPTSINARVWAKPDREIGGEDDCGYAVRMLPPVLTRAEAVERLSAHEAEIRALGVIRLALFGSVLRGQTHADSDVDVLVQFASGAKTYDRFFALSELLERCLGRRVELVTTEALSPFIGPRILAEAEDVLRVA